MCLGLQLGNQTGSISPAQKVQYRAIRIDTLLIYLTCGDALVFQKRLDEAVLLGRDPSVAVSIPISIVLVFVAITTIAGGLVVIPALSIGLISSI